MRESAEEAEVFGPLPWEPIWQRPRTPRSRARKNQEPGTQRVRSQAAVRRHPAAREFRRPRPQELLLRHRARSVAMVCPPSLSLKWQHEMREKFGPDVVIVNSELMARHDGATD
ncbi:hypothetical protein [Streptomyces spirodelae]|uniref:SNF2 N-terminal domain-containing protein n=1 Tax=Streptomyces spirodelae TaxID=2812904 RepID=A0ABS3WQ09_9ACTN|nr:hypothetical protein [Streptomyces spirodelae]MBO8184986.1 hypothetical protein [Streptomyces spirodelae]